MHRVSLTEAQQCLAELVAEATQGEAVIITQADGVAVQLVPVAVTQPRPQFGSARGQITMADDFDAPLEDFADYAP
jgi:prevent-host-death family protein